MAFLLLLRGTSQEASDPLLCRLSPTAVVIRPAEKASLTCLSQGDACCSTSGVGLRMESQPGQGQPSGSKELEHWTKYVFRSQAKGSAKP